MFRKCRMCQNWVFWGHRHHPVCHILVTSQVNDVQPPWELVQAQKFQPQTEVILPKLEMMKVRWDIACPSDRCSLLEIVHVTPRVSRLPCLSTPRFLHLHFSLSFEGSDQGPMEGLDNVAFILLVILQA